MCVRFFASKKLSPRIIRVVTYVREGEEYPQYLEDLLSWLNKKEDKLGVWKNWENYLYDLGFLPDGEVYISEVDQEHD